MAKFTQVHGEAFHAHTWFTHTQQLWNEAAEIRSRSKNPVPSVTRHNSRKPGWLWRGARDKHEKVVAEVVAVVGSSEVLHLSRFVALIDAKTWRQQRLVLPFASFVCSALCERAEFFIVRGKGQRAKGSGRSPHPFKQGGGVSSCGLYLHGMLVESFEVMLVSAWISF